MTSFHPVGGQKYLLNSSIGSTDTTITLQSFTLPVSGTAITMTLLGDIGYGTLAPKSDNSEFISFTGVTQNADGTATLTGVTRGLNRATPFTSDAAYKLPHGGQSIFILSDLPQLFNEYAGLRNDNAFTGINTVITPTAPNQIPTKAYVDAVAGGIATTNQLVVAGTAGETVAAGYVVYLKVSDGLWYNADADTIATVNGVQMGIAQGAATVGVTIAGGVLLEGLDSNQAGGTIGALGYVSNTPGKVSASAGTNSRVLGNFKSATVFYFNPNYYYQLSSAQSDALAGGGSFGTPSTSNKFITQTYLTSSTTNPIVRTYSGKYNVGQSTTTFSITNSGGNTYQYNYTGVGATPGQLYQYINVGDEVVVNAQNFNAANKGTFTVTAVDGGSFYVTNVSGVAESNKTIGTGSILVGPSGSYASTVTYTKPAGLKYAVVRLVGSGAGSGSAASGSAGQHHGYGGGAGAYSEKLIAAASLGATETITLGAGGAPAVAGATTSFGAFLSATGGSATVPYSGGTATGGDININGGAGDYGSDLVRNNGGASMFSGQAPAGYGADVLYLGAGYPGTKGGGGGGAETSSAGAAAVGGPGGPGFVEVIEYYQ